MRGGTARLAIGALGFGFLQCSHARPPALARGTWDYTITVPPAGSWKLTVEATLTGSPVDRIVAEGEEGDAEGFSDVVLATPSDGAPVPVPRVGDGWSVPACRARCTLRYVVDLDRLAQGCRRIDCGRRVGDAVLSQASSWMLRPETPGDATVHLRVQPGSASGRIATGLRRDGSGGYVFSSEDLGEASYTAFGAFRRTPVQVGGATLDVVLLGAPVSMGDAGVVDWVRGAAGCVASLYGRFPLDATVFVVPVPGASDVVFGRVMSLAGASVTLLFGADAEPADAHHDWVAVHELFHLSTPSFVGEGHWLEEGLATYYEPVLRARAGWIPEASLWAELVRNMPRGLRGEGDPPALEDRDGIDATYWGGAIFALLADVRVRTATRGSGHRKSLDDVLRAVLAQRGDATHRARVADFMAIGDAATGTTALSDVDASWAVRGEAPDLDALWRSLGVDAVADAGAGEPGIRLRDDAPLSDVRRAIAGSEH
jgi:predicted metalloprotease with PDZ domain